MENKKYSISFGIVFVCAMLFITCNNTLDPPEAQTSIESGYGRITITFAEEKAALQQARTVFPLMDFDKYVYSFTRADDETVEVLTPDNDGIFTLKVGTYIVEVQAFIGDAELYSLAATGVSPPFDVGPGDNTPVDVSLSEVDTAEYGEFSYTITFPEGAEVEITLHRWPEQELVPLNPNALTEENGITETLELEAGSYLLTVLIEKDFLYAGVSEAVHIRPLLSTVFIKDFDDENLLTTIPPTTNDYIISGIGTFTYDGTARTVSITPKVHASPGAITILYNGTETEPVNTGEYTVTFNVAEERGWNAANGLPAGTITINKADSAVSSWPTAETITYGEALSAAALIGGAGEPSGVFTWDNDAIIPTVTNSGYNVMFTPDDADNYNTVTAVVPITVKKVAGAEVDAPTLNGKTHNSITINPVTAPDTEQSVQYGINTSNDADTAAWQNGLTFSGLNAGTTYYIFARSAEGNNYSAGTASASLQESLYIITINTQPAETTNVTQGSISGSLSVAASAAPSATLSYQWYSNTSNSSIGGTVISGATSESFTIPTTLTAGMYYYFCEVRATGAASVRSSATMVRVTIPLIAVTWSNGNISSSNGEQWFVFTANASVQYIHVIFGTLNNLNIQVYDSNFNTVGIENGTNLSNTTRYTFRTLTIGQVYYIRVTPNSSSGSTYQIAFSMSIIAPIEMVWIHEGEFIMGSPLDEPGRHTNEIQRHVTLTSGFYMGRFQVTQGQWEAVMGQDSRLVSVNSGTNYGRGNNFPMYYVSWYDAILFCNRLSIQEGLIPAYKVPGVANWETVSAPTSSNTDWNNASIVLNSTGYRLPTEAQWEYACRAGTTTTYNTGSSITSSHANFNWNRGGTSTVGSYTANAWGLYDMHGNIWEWCWDRYGSYADGAQTNPKGAGADEGTSRVIRGGSFYNTATMIRSASRNYYDPWGKDDVGGFRLLRP